MKEVQDHCPECMKKYDEHIELVMIEWSPFGRVFVCRLCAKEYAYEDLEVKIDHKGSVTWTQTS